MDTVDPATWRWFFDPLDPGARQLTFAKDVDIATMLTAFGMDPGSAQMLTGAQADELRPLADGFNDPPFQVRVADLGGWVLACEWDQLLDLVSPLRFPEGHDVLMVEWTINTEATFTAIIDGERCFELGYGQPEGQLAMMLERRSPGSQDLPAEERMAIFASELGIPPVTVEMISGPMLTAIRDQ